MLALALSQTKFETRLVAAASPVLQTRAPTMKVSGPTATLLLSSPTISHEIGVIVRIGAPDTESVGANNSVPLANDIRRVMLRSALTRFILDYPLLYVISSRCNVARLMNSIVR